MEFGDRLRVRFGDFLDLHATLSTQDQYRLASVTVERQAEVQLPRDLLGGLAPDFLDGVPLDRHAENLGGRAPGIHWCPGQLDTARLTPPSDGHLRLHCDRPQCARCQHRFVGRPGEAPIWYRDAGSLQALFDLVLERFHRGMLPWRLWGRSIRLSRRSCRDRIRVKRVSFGSMTSSRKPRSAAT